MNDTGLLFDVEDELLARPARSVPAPVVAASEEDFTPVAGVALWGPVLDRLNVVAEGTVWLTVGLMVLRPDIFGAQNPIGKVAGPPALSMYSTMSRTPTSTT